MFVIVNMIGKPSSVIAEPGTPVETTAEEIYEEERRRVRGVSRGKSEMLSGWRMVHCRFLLVLENIFGVE